MKKIIEKASVLIEALPYIQRFRNEVVVVKFGGSIMEDPVGIKSILKDIAFMQCVGLKPVIVHGGGKAITQKMNEKGVRPVFIKGLRVTDEASIRVVEHVLNHEVNPKIVERLNAYGCQALGLHGDDILKADKKSVEATEPDNPIDLGYVGEATNVDTTPVEAFLKSGITPVITPLGKGPDRMIYNVNADEAAAAIAKTLKARKLVFLSDVPGLLENPHNSDTLISTVYVDEIETYIKRGVINGGMLPKMLGGKKALEMGVRKTHIIDWSLPHSLLLELFTDKGVGTEIVTE